MKSILNHKNLLWFAFDGDGESQKNTFWIWLFVHIWFICQRWCVSVRKCVFVCMQVVFYILLCVFSIPHVLSFPTTISVFSKISYQHRNLIIFSHKPKHMQTKKKYLPLRGNEEEKYNSRWGRAGKKTQPMEAKRPKMCVCLRPFMSFRLFLLHIKLFHPIYHSAPFDEQCCWKFSPLSLLFWLPSASLCSMPDRQLSSSLSASPLSFFFYIVMYMSDYLAFNIQYLYSIPNSLCLC